MMDKVTRLVAKAVAAGALAPDSTASDLQALMVAVRGVVTASAEGDDTTWRRFVRTHLAGLRSIG